ncbi:MAG: MarR family winged helix-turn-helix transcriptional regulator [Christensenellales bacterium]
MRPGKNDIIFELKKLDNLLHRLIDARMRQIEGSDQLTRMHHWIIGYLHHHSDAPVFQKDIERAFKISRSTTSSMITLMEKKGLITRTSVEGDARLKQVHLTEKAIELRERHIADAERFDALIEGAITPDEKAQFMRIMAKVRAVVEGELNADAAQSRPEANL